MEIDKLIDEFCAQEADYHQIKEIATEYLNSLVKELGLKCDIQSRVKDAESFAKKALRKGYKNPFIEITDKVGCRVIVDYENDLEKVSSAIKKKFQICQYEDKIDALEYDQLGYLGIHFEASLPSNLEICSEKSYNEFVFEIQLHTRAQNLWAGISHQLSYKPNFVKQQPSVEIKRSIYRLIALIEIFDKEVSTAQNAILSQPDFPEARLLAHLEKHFNSLSSKKFDRDFSIQNISNLKKLLKDKEVDDFEQFINQFVEKHYQKLSSIFEKYEHDKRETYNMLMLFQPESLLIFERLESDRFRLLNLWKQTLPEGLLLFLANVWGINLGE